MLGNILDGLVSETQGRVFHDVKLCCVARYNESSYHAELLADCLAHTIVKQCLHGHLFVFH